jgi:hypothetical protein
MEILVDTTAPNQLMKLSTFLKELLGVGRLEPPGSADSNGFEVFGTHHSSQSRTGGDVSHGAINCSVDHLSFTGRSDTDDLSPFVFNLFPKESRGLIAIFPPQLVCLSDFHSVITDIEVNRPVRFALDN